MIRNILIIGFALLASVLRAEVSDGIAQKVVLSRSGDFMLIEMDIDLAQVDVQSDEAVLFTPRLVKGNDEKILPEVGVYGRRRYIQYERNGLLPANGSESLAIKEKDKPAIHHYRTVL